MSLTPIVPPKATGEELGLIVGHSLDVAERASSLGQRVGRRDVEVPAGPAGEVEVTVGLVEVDGVVVLARHGLDRFTPAHLVDHHAHMRALCEAGVGRVLAMASCGSLRADLEVGSMLWPHDFLAPWVAPSFHRDDRGHSVPGFDVDWRAEAMAKWAEASEVAAPGGPAAIDGGVYAQTSGPRFETPAEVRMLAAFADVVGMTLVGEAVLAREAGLRYAAVCTVDNLANGLDERPLTTDDFHAGVAETRTWLARVVAELLPRLREAG